MIHIRHEMDDAAYKEIKATLRSLDRRAATIEAAVEKLKEELQSNRAERQRLVDLLTPINDLPSETLADIWDYTRECHKHPRVGGENWSHGACRWRFKIAPSVLKMSWVSRRWRGVALTSPLLWSDLVVSPHTSLELARMKVERSQSCPLTIIVNFANYCDDEDIHDSDASVAHFLSLMEVIQPHVARWRTLEFIGCFGIMEMSGHVTSINGPAGKTIVDACTGILATTPATQLMNIRVQYDSDLPVELPEFMRGGLPALRRATVHGMDVRSCLPALTSLTSLDLRIPSGQRPTPTQLRDFILACPDLSTLSLHGPPMEYFLDPPEDYNYPIITAPAVRSLRIAFNIDEEHLGYYFFKAFSLPNVETLRIHDSTQEQLDLFALQLREIDFTGRIDRFPKLRKFSSHYNRFSPDSARLMLQYMPTITDLEMDHFDMPQVTRYLLEDASSQGQVRACCPLVKLKTLTWNNATNEPAATEAVLRYVVAERITCGFPIAKLRVDRGFLQLHPDVQRWYRERIDVEVVPWIPQDEAGYFI